MTKHIRIILWEKLSNDVRKARGDEIMSDFQIISTQMHHKYEFLCINTVHMILKITD